MERIKTFIYTLLAILVFTGCGENSYESNIDAIPFKEEYDDLWGAIRADGKILFSNEFKNLPSNVIDGVFFVKENGTYSLYSAEEKPKLLMDGLLQIGEISEHSDFIIGVKENSHILVIDKKGNIVKELIDIDGMEVRQISNTFYNGYLIAQVKKNSTIKFALLNAKCELVKIYEELTDLKDICNGMSLIKTPQNEWIIKDMSDKNIISIDKRYEPVSIRGGKYIKNNMICAINGDGRLFISIDGNVNKCPSRIKKVVDFNKDAYIFRSSDGGYGVMSMKHDVLVRDKYDRIDFIENGYIAKIGDNYEILNHSGDVISKITSEDFPYVSGFSAYIVKTGSRYTLANPNGEEINKSSYSKVYEGTQTEEWIQNDYVNWNSQAQELIDSLMILAKYSIGKTLNEYDHLNLKSNKPQKYSGETIASYDFLKERKLEIRMFECFDSKIAKSSYSYYNYNYSWNDEARVNRIAAKVQASNDEMYNNCKNILDSKEIITLTGAEAEEVAEIYNRGKYHNIYNAYTCYQTNNDDIIFIGYVYDDNKSYSTKEFIIGVTKKVEKEVPDTNDNINVSENTKLEKSKATKKKTTKKTVNDEW